MITIPSHLRREGKFPCSSRVYAWEASKRALSRIFYDPMTLGSKARSSDLMPILFTLQVLLFEIDVWVLHARIRYSLKERRCQMWIASCRPMIRRLRLPWVSGRHSETCISGHDAPKSNGGGTSSKRSCLGAGVEFSETKEMIRSLFSNRRSHRRPGPCISGALTCRYPSTVDLSTCQHDLSILWNAVSAESSVSPRLLIRRLAEWHLSPSGSTGFIRVAKRVYDMADME